MTHIPSNKEVRRPPGYYFSITNGQQISLCSAFVRDEKLKGKFVNLGFAARKNAIIFHFTDGAISLRFLRITEKNNAKHSGRLSVKSFFKEYGIDAAEYRGRHAIVQESIPHFGVRWVAYLGGSND